MQYRVLYTFPCVYYEMVDLLCSIYRHIFDISYILNFSSIAIYSKTLYFKLSLKIFDQLIHRTKNKSLPINNTVGHFFFFSHVDVNTGDNYTCSCLDGFVGIYCDDTFCSVKPCRNRGLCVIKNKVFSFSFFF